jgi:hypothetical protein
MGCNTRSGVGLCKLLPTHGSTRTATTYTTIGTIAITTNTPRFAADLGLLFSSMVPDIRKLVATVDGDENTHQPVFAMPRNNRSIQIGIRLVSRLRSPCRPNLKIHG